MTKIIPKRNLHGGLNGDIYYIHEIEPEDRPVARIIFEDERICDTERRRLGNNLVDDIDTYGKKKEDIFKFCLKIAMDIIAFCMMCLFFICACYGFVELVGDLFNK